MAETGYPPYPSPIADPGTLACSRPWFIFFQRLVEQLASGGGGGGGTVTHTGPLTADQIVLGNGSDDLKVLGTFGTAGQVLTSQGAGLAPIFEATPTDGVPYFIADGDTYTVPEPIQALFAMTMDVEGILEVEGYLIEVEDCPCDGAGSLAPLAASTLVGRGADGGAGDPEAVTLGPYLSMTGTVLDVAGAGLTPFIVQDLGAVRRSAKVPPDYLPNAQEMAKLASGYVTVESGTGVLGSIAVIPAADIDPTVARTDQANVFTQDQQIDTKSLLLNESAKPVDHRLWQIVPYEQVLYVQAVNDAQTVADGSLLLTRDGNLYTTGAHYEKARTTPMGYWIDVALNAANFGTDGGAWTGVTTVYNRYMLLGQTLFWEMYVNGGSLAASANLLFIAMPAGAIGSAYSGPTALAYGYAGAAEQRMRGTVHANGSAFQINLVPYGPMPAGPVTFQFSATIALA